MLPVDGRTVFITGCDSGFGHQLACRLDKLGLTVFAGCLIEGGDGAQKLRSLCSRSLKIVPIDVTSDDSVRLAQKIVEDSLPDKSKGLWAVVNNAGIWRWGEIEWAKVDIFKEVAEVNVYGMVRVTKAFLPLIRQAKGRIVNVGSMSGMFTVPAGATYCMSKICHRIF
ncbi:D-beta-hydroxybutyrate dehydrogenase, mitochondrial-like [Ptychodera flava]|uniref:D-beta-hydroxybutyrate dehydrogenase, mitochondrial-like n=1 Tax=Ptychodera flava TaxID=63121 RepID=UPI00396A9E9A